MKPHYTKPTRRPAVGNPKQTKTKRNQMIAYRLNDYNEGPQAQTLKALGHYQHRGIKTILNLNKHQTPTLGTKTQKKPLSTSKLLCYSTDSPPRGLGVPRILMGNAC